ncbi:MAG: 16S rRNA (guanine(966)-N(2))-methyltransferase RsmD [Candidatus Binatia bacterium]
MATALPALGAWVITARPVRVIAGTHGGVRLSPVPGQATRPTAERVREALFSRLQSRFGLAGARLLDLFAGTGALGIESLSRGASGLVFVEKNPRAVAVLRANLESCDMLDRSEVLCGEALSRLALLARDERVFDGVFVDPPYRGGASVAVLEKLGGLGLLAAGAWVSVETDRREALPGAVGGLARLRVDQYGDTRLWLYRASGPGDRE